ncbi:MAG: electron transport complex subunit RsxD [Gammaproteobacteria bacterium]|nr:MAG: electron transport complex subunit RsxD [Gammaproteobacteria bacterium]
MSVLSITSPHAHRPFTTGQLMLQVVIATLPGVAALTWFFGWGTLINIFWAVPVALASEALVLKLRNKPIGFFLKDYSAVVTAILLAMAIPPTAPWWLTLTGVSFAIIVAKHLYGGLGSNPFNPAMIGYVLLLISFPVEMTAWLPSLGTEAAAELSFSQSFAAFLGGQINGQGIDAYTMATPLDIYRTYKGNFDALNNAAALKGNLAGIGWEWVNLAFLVGGLYLITRKIITWHIPVAMLGTLTLLALLFGAGDPDTYPGPLFHLLSGGTMLGAFFIATDPVSAATSNRGKLVYGAGIGLFIYVIRSWGGYPDAVAFSVLLLNLCAPTIDYYTQPRTYGHAKANRGMSKPE